MRANRTRLVRRHLAKSYANLGEGAHTFTVKATDAAGNTGQDSYSWTSKHPPPSDHRGKPRQPDELEIGDFAYTASEPTQCKPEAQTSRCSSPAYLLRYCRAHIPHDQANDAATTRPRQLPWVVDAPPVVSIVETRRDQQRQITFDLSPSPPRTPPVQARRWRIR